MKRLLSGVIGNILGHYDNALFGLLAPFIAPLFFDDRDPITALILTYAMLPMGILTRPLGSLFFGWIGDLFGRRQALFCSLFGMAIVTVVMGCLPLYRDVGLWAPAMLAIGRMLQSFCAAGESTGGSIFILEQIPVSKRSLFSSFYDVSSIGGILIASGLVTFLSICGWVEEGWRYLFWAGGSSAIFGLYLRLKTSDSREFTDAKKRTSLMQALKEHRGALLAIIFASGFSFVTYSLAFTLMNGYVPLVTVHSKTDVMQINTLLLMADLLLLPLFGYLAHKWGKERVMLTAGVISAVCALPLFASLDQASIGSLIAIRVAIMALGVAFAAPYHAWALERVPPQHRYTILSLGSALGSQLIGAPCSVVSLWLYKQTGWVSAPGIYFLVVALLASASIAIRKRSEAVQRAEG